MTWAEYLQENLECLPIHECIELLEKAEKGVMSDLATEQELTPVEGTILSDLFNNDRETFESVLGKIKDAAYEIQEREAGYSFKLCPIGKASDAIPKIILVMVMS